ncbi:MAG: histidine phosphatase family protein [Candidatus Shapirobacteria bacterium]|jgi:broad specificity phosphatase PhoE
MSSETLHVKIKEDETAVLRYQKLKSIGQEVLASGSFILTDHTTESDANLGKKILTEGIHETNPPLWASYFEHIIIAPEYGKKIASSAADCGLDVNPYEIEFLLHLHDVGRLVTSSAYLRNDYIGNRLLVEFGIPRPLLRNLPSNEKLMSTAETMNLDHEQLTFQSPLNEEQKKIASEYFEGMSPTTRIINFADNLGKRDKKNGLFNAEIFLSYLKSQESRYDQSSLWPSIKWALPKRQAGAILQSYIIEKTVEWLTNLGVDLNEIHDQLSDFGPHFIVVARHGELNNPKNIVYNRDSFMLPEDRIHLSDSGKNQMEILGQTLHKRQFNVTQIIASPEERAQESAKFISDQLGNPPIAINPNLDDNFSPGPYREKMTMNQLAEIGGNVYSQRWEKYQHEQPDSVVKRMHQQFMEMSNSLKTGETGVLVSHGDPIAWLLNTLQSELIPNPEDLRHLEYPAKGEAVIVIINSDNTIYSSYSTRSFLPTNRKIY